jgi:hypothetical protein
MEKIKNFFEGAWKWVKSSVAALLALFLPKAWPSLAKAIVGGISALLVTAHTSVNPTYVAGGDIWGIPLSLINEIITYAINGVGTYITVWAIANQKPSVQAKANPVIRTALDVPPK